LGDVVVAGTHAEAVVIFQFVIMVGKSLNLDLVRMKLTLWCFAQALRSLRSVCGTCTACGVLIALVANEISSTGARYIAQVGGRGSQEAGLKTVYAY
jgi:hypothetical protein